MTAAGQNPMPVALQVFNPDLEGEHDPSENADVSILHASVRAENPRHSQKTAVSKSGICWI
jgi:hypothetical protein